MRFLHVSDVHVDVPPWALPLSTLFNKRLLGLANLVVRRYRRFSRARAKLDALARLRAEHEIEAVLCTGDLTALGTLPELEAAQRALAPLFSAPGGYVVVPGNHDVYVPDAADGRFERAFGDGLLTDAPHVRGPSGFPTCRFFGDHVAVVCVNSARPNPQPWRSSGRIPDHELHALRVRAHALRSAATRWHARLAPPRARKRPRAAGSLQPHRTGSLVARAPPSRVRVALPGTAYPGFLRGQRHGPWSGRRLAL
jgi:3',5'-cyclic AMP phosphodiesterase CpdA